MSVAHTFRRSTIGQKVIASVTGVILLGFLITHVVGNLKAFLPDVDGVPEIDIYAGFLRTMGDPLVPHHTVINVTRAVLLLALAAHVWAVVSLARRNRAARPVPYHASLKRVGSSAPAHWMIATGAVLGLFALFHILHLTTGTIDAQRFIEGDVYGNLHRAFHQWPFVVIYLGAMGVMGFHLFHGTWSLFQTLGLDNPDRNRMLRGLAAVTAIALFLGFGALPVAFYLDILPEPAAFRGW